MRLRYSPVRDLARALALSRWRSACLVMLAAYIDESGTTGSGAYLILGGLAATGEQWEALEIEWDRAKAEYDFPINPKTGKYVAFHAADFFGGYGDFKHYAGRRTKQELYERLLRIMQRHISASAFTIILYEAWELHMQGDAKEKTLVYSISALGLASRLYRWASRKGEALEYVMERADGIGQLSASEAVEKLGDFDLYMVESVTRRRKGSMPALDTPDIWCHELKLYLNQLLKEGNHTPRSEMRRLLKIPQYCGFVVGNGELGKFLNCLVENEGKGSVVEIPIQAVPIPFKFLNGSAVGV